MVRTRILSFFGMAATFAVAYGFERLVFHMRTQVGLTTSAGLAKSTMWVESIALVVLAAMLLLLAWYVLSRAGRDIWVGAAFVVVGLGLTFMLAIEISVERVLLSDRLMEFVSPSSYGHHVAAFVLVVGIACLVAPKPRRR